ncbi:MAG TPA: zf-HC2 domain-containing protein [Planctomycetota bacterium]|nr:zf-HC2 domain-containing protein [Planctomycetota bacterium]
MNATVMKVDCAFVRDHVSPYVAGQLEQPESHAVSSHVRACARCRMTVENIRAIQLALQDTSEDETGEAPLLATAETSEQPSAARWSLSAAPWWAVSVVLHGLVIALAGLISMAIELPRGDDAIVTVTELINRPEIEQAVKKRENHDNALHSKHETPPTDPTSKEAMDVIVPPELLSQAELGDHFETINPDRPDTQSAFGNPDAQMFHSKTGNDEDAGGGGTGGFSLDDAIGVGGAASPGSGGGWGGGNGSGIGVGTGSGRGSFGNRGGGGRKLMVKRHGGSPATENAVDKALYWLVRHQEADGHWDIKKHEGGMQYFTADPGRDEAVTGLAALAFLGAGHTPKVGTWKDTVRKAIEWIMSRQQPNGAFSQPRLYGFDRYDDAICTLALAEAYGMTNDKRIGAAAQKAVDHICSLQAANGSWEHGGWQSTSVLGWMVMALKSAKVANLKVPVSAFEGAYKRLEEVGEKDADGYWGMVAYCKKGGYDFAHKGLTTTAIGMLSLQFMGRGHETENQAEIVGKHLPAWEPDKEGHGALGGTSGYQAAPQNFYHWYYSTLAMFQSGGGRWKKWNEALVKTLVPNQRKGGPEDGSTKDVDGSWDPVTQWDQFGGRVYTTAMGALCLEVYYRYALLNDRKE